MKVRVTYELDIPECTVAEARQLVFDELVHEAVTAKLDNAIDCQNMLAYAKDANVIKRLQASVESYKKWVGILHRIKTVEFQLHLAPLE